MRITDLPREDGILLGAAAADKENAIDLLVELQDQAGNLTGKARYRADILAREAHGGAAIGFMPPILSADLAAGTAVGMLTLALPKMKKEAV